MLLRGVRRLVGPLVCGEAGSWNTKAVDEIVNNEQVAFL